MLLSKLLLLYWHLIISNKHGMFLQHYCMNWSQDIHKRKYSINRQNDFSFTKMKLVYYLRRKALKSNGLIQSIYMFLQKEASQCRDRSVIFLATSFIGKMSKSSYSMPSSIVILPFCFFVPITCLQGPN